MRDNTSQEQEAGELQLKYQYIADGVIVYFKSVLTNADRHFPDGH